MDKPKIMDVVQAVVSALEPFEGAERKRIIKAAMTILGDEAVEVEAPKAPVTPTQVNVEGGNKDDLHPSAQRWMQMYGITREDLDQVFHIENGATQVLSVELPGSNRKANTHSTYELVGIASLISTGEPSVDDKVARKMCESLGCYDTNNHASYMNDAGTVLIGTKKSGFKLSAPGLREAATLVKKIANPAKKTE